MVNLGCNFIVQMFRSKVEIYPIIVAVSERWPKPGPPNAGPPL